jgi:N-acetylglucosamine kinase-like BadF-type ATPase
VFKIAYDELVLGVISSAITGMITSRFGNDIMPLIQVLDSEGGNEVKRAFVRIFFEALNEGDPVACRTAEHMALRGAQMITAHLRDGDFAAPCEIVLCGSIHTKLPSDVYVNMLAQKAQELSGRELIFSKLTRAPVMGCIDWMLA